MTKLRLLSIVLFLGLSGGCTTTVGGVLQQSGFNEVRPPSTLLNPGSIVAISSYSPVLAEIVCDPHDSLGLQTNGPDPSLLSSNSATTSLQTQTSQTLSIDANYLKALKANAQYSSVENITVNLSNTKVYAISGSNAVNWTSRRTPSCWTAMSLYEHAGKPVSLVEEVFQADADYHIVFSSSAKLDANAQQGLVKGLSAQLGADINTATTSDVHGTGLYWGLTDSRLLAYGGQDQNLQPSLFGGSAPPRLASVFSSTPSLVSVTVIGGPTQPAH
jgi:hypothetical protein